MTSYHTKSDYKFLQEVLKKPLTCIRELNSSLISLVANPKHITENDEFKKLVTNSKSKNLLD